MQEAGLAEQENRRPLEMPDSSKQMREKEVDCLAGSRLEGKSLSGEVHDNLMQAD